MVKRQRKSVLSGPKARSRVQNTGRPLLRRSEDQVASVQNGKTSNAKNESERDPGKELPQMEKDDDFEFASKSKEDRMPYEAISEKPMDFKNELRPTRSVAQPKPRANVSPGPSASFNYPTEGPSTFDGAAGSMGSLELITTPNSLEMVASSALPTTIAVAGSSDKQPSDIEAGDDEKSEVEMAKTKNKTMKKRAPKAKCARSKAKTVRPKSIVSQPEAKTATSPDTLAANELETQDSTIKKPIEPKSNSEIPMRERLSSDATIRKPIEAKPKPEIPKQERLQPDKANKKKEQQTIKEKMAEEQLMMKQRAHEMKMKKVFEREATFTATVANTTAANHNEESESVCEEIIEDHPDDIVTANGNDSEFEVSDLSDNDLCDGSGGIHIELKNLEPDLYVSTLTVVLTASVYQNQPAWRDVDKTGKIIFDKKKAHRLFRVDLKRFCSRMKPQWQWSFDDWQTCLFEEVPDEPLHISDLKSHIPKNAYEVEGGRNHAHILMEYAGNMRRGTKVKALIALQEFMENEGWHTYWSTAYSYNDSRPLYSSRIVQQTYLMVPTEAKGHVDLTPSSSRTWSPQTIPDLKQWKTLHREMNRPAPRDTAISVIRNLEGGVPSNAESCLEILRRKIAEHSELYALNKHKWKELWYVYLPYRQTKRYVEKAVATKGAWSNLAKSITVSGANQTEQWGFSHFWKKSLGMRCVCGVKEGDMSEPDLKRMKLSCPKVPDWEQDCLGGRDPMTVRQFVLQTSLYKVLKLSTKYKGFKEPEYQIIYKMGEHFFKLLSEDLPSMGKRLQNCHWASLDGDTGKSALMHAVCGVYECTSMDDDSAEHIVLSINPESFGMNGCSDAQLYKCVKIAELTPTTVSGSIVRLLLESDKGFRAPVKGDHIKLKKAKSPFHHIVFMCSNIPSREVFADLVKELGAKSSWVKSDYDRNIGPDGSRVGATFLSETKVPAIYRKELNTCPACSAKFLRWLLRKYILSRDEKYTQSLENIWIDSDTDGESDNDIDESTEFWKALKMDGEKLEAKITEEAIQLKRTQKQTITFTPEELESYYAFKAHQAKAPEPNPNVGRCAKGVSESVATKEGKETAIEGQ